MIRRWRPFRLPSHGLTADDGAAVLRENPGGVGIPLWSMAQDICLWAEALPGEMATLFAPSAERQRRAAFLAATSTDLPDAGLALLAGMLQDPGSARRGVIAAAAALVATWAERSGAPATAFAYAVGAAYACPMDPLRSYQAGRLARRSAEYARAEQWLTRAILLARQAHDWDTYARAHSGLGNVYVQRGSYPRARKHHARCLHAAERHQIPSLAGNALHDLAGIAIVAGDLRTANDCARRAILAYGPAHPQLPVLAHDLAYAWMEAGHYADALPVFEAALPCFPREQRVLVLADIARAAAGVGDPERFDRAWHETSRWIEQESAEDHVAQALLDLASGALFLRDWTRAEQAACGALEVAVRRSESRVRLSAEALLDTVQARLALAATPPPPVDPGLRRLASDLEGTLRRAALAAGA